MILMFIIFYFRSNLQLKKGKKWKKCIENNGSKNIRLLTKKKIRMYSKLERNIQKVNFD